MAFLPVDAEVVPRLALVSRRLPLTVSVSVLPGEERVRVATKHCRRTGWVLLTPPLLPPPTTVAEVVVVVVIVPSTALSSGRFAG